MKFGKLGTVVLSAAIGLVAATAQASERHFQVGLQLYTVRDDCAKDLPGVLKAVARMGYSGVEFAGYYGRSAAELRQMLDEDHLKCYGTHVGLDTLEGDNLDATIKFNKELGNKLIVVPWIPPEQRSSHAKILETAKLFDEIAAKLAKSGMILAYHDHADDFRPVDGEVPWEVFFQNTDRRVAIEFDTGNALEAGVQAAPLIAQYPGRVLSVHVKDFSASKPQVLLGEGDEDWKAVLPLLKGKAGTRWFIIEQETYPFPPLECAEKCLRNFETMMNAKS
jgi:sugar phosphate isomerase/epimerase